MRHFALVIMSVVGLSICNGQAVEPIPCGNQGKLARIADIFLFPSDEVKNFAVESNSYCVVDNKGFDLIDWKDTFRPHITLHQTHWIIDSEEADQFPFYNDMMELITRNKYKCEIKMGNIELWGGEKSVDMGQSINRVLNPNNMLCSADWIMWAVEPNPCLERLHASIVTVASSYKCILPQENSLENDIQQEYVLRYGYDSVLQNFRPHVTLCLASDTTTEEDKNRIVAELNERLRKQFDTDVKFAASHVGMAYCGKHGTVLRESNQKPVLEEGEHEIALQAGVGLYNDLEKIEQCQKGLLFITTHKIIWQDMTRTHNTHALALHLSQVASIDTRPVKYVSLKQSPKIGLYLRNQTGCVRLSFREGGRDMILKVLMQALAAKEWEHPPVTSVQVTSTSSSELAKLPGIWGLQERIKEKHKQNDETMQVAFKDLDGLMEKAKEMVELSKRISSQINKQQDEESSDLQNFMLSMGIDNPVTKKSAGSSYHVQLAREIAGFVEVSVKKPQFLIRTSVENLRCGSPQPLLSAKPGSMIALPDLYCLINRARGQVLISPSDLYRSAVLMDQLNLPVVLRKFDSGVIVIQSRNHDDATICVRMRQIVETLGHCTSFDVAKHNNISLILANEQLLTAENAGMICRDDNIEGLYFYPNKFHEY